MGGIDLIYGAHSVNRELVGLESDQELLSPQDLKLLFDPSGKVFWYRKWYGATPGGAAPFLASTGIDNALIFGPFTCRVQVIHAGRQ